MANEEPRTLDETVLSIPTQAASASNSSAPHIASSTEGSRHSVPSAKSHGLAAITCTRTRCKHCTSIGGLGFPRSPRIPLHVLRAEGFISRSSLSLLVSRAEIRQRHTLVITGTHVRTSNTFIGVWSLLGPRASSFLTAWVVRASSTAAAD